MFPSFVSIFVKLDEIFPLFVSIFSKFFEILILLFSIFPKLDEISFSKSVKLLFIDSVFIFL